MILSRPTCVITTLFAACLATGCATIGFSETRSSDRLIKVTKEEVAKDAVKPADGDDKTPASFGVAARIKQSGTEVQIRIARPCDRRMVRNVERTTTWEANNGSPTWDYVLLAGAGVLGVVGAVLVVDSSKVYANDGNSRQYNRYGPDTPRTAGIASLAAGGAMLLVPIIDAVRANQTRDEVSQVKVEGALIEANILCSDNPLRHTAIKGVLGDRQIPLGILPGDEAPAIRTKGVLGSRQILLGESNDAGKLEIDLADLIAAEAAEGPDRPGEMQVVVGESKVGRLDMGPVYRLLDDRAWKRLDTRTCTSPTGTTSCDAVREYIKKFPASKYAAEAQRMLDDAGPRLRQLREEELWSVARPKACSEGKSEEACDWIKRYLDEFPAGSHADEARAAAKKAEDRLAAQKREKDKTQRSAACRAKCAPNCKGGADTNCMNSCMKLERCP